MQREDLFYLFVLLFSIPFGHLLKLCQCYDKKKFISCVTGISLVLLLCGKQVLHSFILILGNYVIVKVAGIQRCRWVSFSYVFFYLFVMRMLIYHQLLENDKYANVIQLMVTLRMVSLPFELYGNACNNKEENENIRKQKGSAMYDFFAYGYCYIGLVTGPFYTFKTYHDMLVTDHIKTSTVLPALRNLKLLPFLLVAYVFLSTYFPIPYIGTDEYLNHAWGLPYQLLILAPTFMNFRWRFYIAWLSSEAACMTAGLGAYPLQCEAKSGRGPTKEFDPSEESENDIVYGFETIRNIDIYRVETSPTMQHTMRDWNTTVQWWLATYVYRELPIHSKQVRMFILLFVSAFWHGVHPGYYLTFLSVPFVVLAETRMIRAVSPYLNDTGKYFLDWVTNSCLYRSFEYLGVGFMLLDLKTILKVWSKMYFIGHGFILLFILLPIVIPKRKQVQNTKND